jgi:hypothetical protein
MSHEDTKRVLLDFAFQLDRGEPISDSQREFLSIVLYRIATGEDANKVLGTVGGKGKTLSAIIARRRMSMILHWVAGATDTDSCHETEPMTVSEACVQAMATIVPKAQAAFPGADHREFDAEYIERCWGEPTYKHMRSPERGWFDPDYPYYKLPSVKDPR